MQEVLLYIREIEDIGPKAQIESIHLLKDIAFKCGYKIRIVASPNAEEKQEVVSRIIFLSMIKLKQTLFNQFKLKFY